MKKFATVKGRVWNFVEKQGVKKEIFLQKIDIDRSNFSGKSAESELSADKIVKILTEYPQINPEWLLLGVGPMLRSANQENTSVQKSDNNSAEILQIIEHQKELIKTMSETIKTLSEANKNLSEQLKKDNAQTEGNAECVAAAG